MVKSLAVIACMLAAILAFVPRSAAQAAATCRSPKLTSFTAARLVYVGERPVAHLGLSCAAAGTVRVSLKSSDSKLGVPGHVTIGRHHRTAAVSLAPKADIAGQYTATLTARLGKRSLARTVTVDPGISKFVLPPCSVPNCVDPEVLFTGNLPAGGITVKFASDSKAVTMPSSFTFAAGSVGGGIPGITVKTVSKNTKVTLSAKLGNRTFKTSITLIPPFRSGDSMKLADESGSGPIYGQEFDLEFVAVLSNPAPASGLTVTFSSPSPDLELQNTTWNVTPGFADAYVDINTADVTSAVHTTLNASVDGVKASLKVTIEPGLAMVTTPATITGGTSATGTVSLAGPVDRNTKVSLQSLDGILTVPATVTIAAGKSSASFTIKAGTVTSDATSQISAMLGSTTIYSSTVTVTP